MSDKLQTEKKKLYYICSPYRANTAEEMNKNRQTALLYQKAAESIFSCRAVAPHTILPNFLDDTIEAERKLALKFGLDLLDVCDAIVICGDTVSEGMAREIEKAKRIGLKTEHLKYHDLEKGDLSI